MLNGRQYISYKMITIFKNKKILMINKEISTRRVNCLKI